MVLLNNETILFTMNWRVLLLCSIIVTSLAQEEVNNKSFPNDFMFGTGTSSYQIEGAWNEDGKGESIWDHFVHTHSESIEGGATGDVACDSYHKYKEDVALLKDLGVDHYLFSLSWSRILPNGTADKINTAGVNYYKNLIKELKDNSIEPVVTLNHMDLPEILEKQGGWVDNFIIDIFADYARLCFELFGDDVKYWLTFNDPIGICLNGYGFGFMAPAISETAILDYKCGHILLKSHAKVWHIYDEEFRSKQNGKVSIALSTNWYEPKIDDPDYEDAAERKRQYSIGWFANPIFKGDYPEVMQRIIASRSSREGRRTSRLPKFTPEEITYVLGTYDFLALNMFTSSVIKPPREEPEVASPNYNDDVGVIVLTNSEWPSSASSWLKITPWGIRKLLNWIKDTYNNPDIFIMGNGVSDNGTSFNDEIRINYHRDYLSNIRSAMEDGVNVIGYTAWTLMDSFEWISGYSLAQEEVNNKSFPNDFMFGTGTSAYQIEGAWNEDGKGESIWDHLVHTQSKPVEGGATGDVACDSYHKYKEDVALLKDLGVDHYLFSLSWSRILPNGTSDTVNTAGVNYYKNLIKELKDNAIEPIVTLYHMDLPQFLQIQGGWIDNFIIDIFADYARLCFELFGDDVKYWLTFNEPIKTCLDGYGFGTIAPAIQSSAILDYKCAHILLKAHARVWHMYDEEFRSKQNGKVSIALSTNWYEPADDSPDHVEAAETKRQYTIGWFANPIFNGDYPEVMQRIIASRSSREGRRTSRLPKFTPEEITYVLGTHDFLALNTYTSTIIQKPREEPEVAKPNYNDDVEVDQIIPSEWPSSASSWLKITPWGIRKLLNWIKDTYSNPDIFIMANGVSDDGSSLNDEIRINYYRDYLSNVRSAMEDGVNVIGYTAWSLMDNFEWMRGYTEKFGLYSVDFESENRTRTPKSSVEYFKKVVSTHCLVETCEEE